jgi:hypothetical protein
VAAHSARTAAGVARRRAFVAPSRLPSELTVTPLEVLRRYQAHDYTLLGVLASRAVLVKDSENRPLGTAVLARWRQHHRGCAQNIGEKRGTTDFHAPLAYRARGV